MFDTLHLDLVYSFKALVFTTRKFKHHDYYGRRPTFTTQATDTDEEDFSGAFEERDRPCDPQGRAVPPGCSHSTASSFRRRCSSPTCAGSHHSSQDGACCSSSTFRAHGSSFWCPCRARSYHCASHSRCPDRSRRSYGSQRSSTSAHYQLSRWSRDCAPENFSCPDRSRCTSRTHRWRDPGPSSGYRAASEHPAARCSHCANYGRYRNHRDCR